MELYRRENYLKKIRGFYHDTGMIKVISGVRRCGKSCLMQTIAEELMESGIQSEQLIFLDLDAKENRKIKDADSLEELIDSRAVSENVKYLFIDEIQNIPDFEELINAYRNEGDFSIFITGSNSYLLSGELATKLTGRYIEMDMFPLTFEEYIGMKEFYGYEISADLTQEADRYILEGGFPKTLEYNTLEDKRTYVRSVIQEIIEKDIRRRKKIRNMTEFNKVMTYMINNFGAPTNLSNIVEDLHKSGSHIKRETAARYVQILADAKILYPCERFDLKSRRSLNGEQKYYLADLSFYFAANTDNRINYGPVLENMVYLYARSKGYAASIGKIGNLECDFILRGSDLSYSYVQVSMTIMDSRKTEDREYRPFEKIRDNYPKYLITRNDMIQKRDGIIHVNIGPFMKAGTMF